MNNRDILVLVDAHALKKATLVWHAYLIQCLVHVNLDKIIVF